jgi:hypothetical protein
MYQDLGVGKVAGKAKEMSGGGVRLVEKKHGVARLVKKRSSNAVALSKQKTLDLEVCTVKGQREDCWLKHRLTLYQNKQSLSFTPVAIA